MKPSRSGIFTVFSFLAAFSLTGTLGRGAGEESASAAGQAPPAPVNRHVPHPPVTRPAEGLSWPPGQALPTFASVTENLDVLPLRGLSRDEQITFSALQGLVNRKRPRIYLMNPRAEEGALTWPSTPTVNLKPGREYAPEQALELIAKYAGELSGVVLYDPERSPHYRNLAGTVAGIRGALPVTLPLHAALAQEGIHLEVVEDLTRLEPTTAPGIYRHLLAQWWPQCGRRVLVSAKPHDDRGGGDYHHTRDMAAATGSAVVWLDTRSEEECAVLREFFRGMEAGNAIALGWYTTERTGIPLASEFGIGTLPADHFVSSTVFAGTAPEIRIPPVPAKPVLAAKTYAAVFISDGDNIQYTQHAMRRIWDRSAETVRGRMPLNWTIAPGLADVAPGILNYYYSTATPADCFVTGPSGMGYLMPFNTLEEDGATVGDKLTDPARMAGYARLTETYLQRSGLRAATIWDDATPMQRAAYETHCRQLYGMTVQNFRDVPHVAGGVVNRRLRFEKLLIPYAGTVDHVFSAVQRSLRRQARRNPGAPPAPRFLSWQVDVWSQLKPDRLPDLRSRLEQEFPGQIEFVRADHWFNLLNEAEGLPYNLCMDSGTSVQTGGAAGTIAQSASPAAASAPGPASADGSGHRGSPGPGPGPDTDSATASLPPAGNPESASAGTAFLTDGTPSSVWTAPRPGAATLTFSLPGLRQVSRCLIRHAEAGGLDPALNTRAWTVETSPDGRHWQHLHTCQGSTARVTDFEFPAIPARFVRIFIGHPGADGTARIADVELYGSTTPWGH